MALPQSSNSRTPQRTTTQYTVGNPTLTPISTTTATAPNVGMAKVTPQVVTLIGSDVNSASVTIGALAAGASAAFTMSIPFPHLPTPLVVGQADVARFIVSAVSLTHAIAGLVLASFAIVPNAFAQGGGTYQSESLQAGTTYTGWKAVVSGTVTAVAATASGTLTARVTASIYDVLG